MLSSSRLYKDYKYFSDGTWYPFLIESTYNDGETIKFRVRDTVTQIDLLEQTTPPQRATLPPDTTYIDRRRGVQVDAEGNVIGPLSALQNRTKQAVPAAQRLALLPLHRPRRGHAHRGRHHLEAAFDMSTLTKTIQTTLPGKVSTAQRIGFTLALVLAFVWAFAGILKIWNTIPMLIEDPSRLFTASSDPDPSVWSDNFSLVVIFAVAIAEFLAAWFISSGKGVRGLLIGCTLLAAFLIAVSLWPISPGSTCGCFGRKVTLPGSPESRLALLGGMHALSLALIACPRSEAVNN